MLQYIHEFVQKIR